MTMTPVMETHIYRDERGKAWLAQTGCSVRELIEIYKAYGESPAEIARQFPHLTFTLIHAGLAYYYDHREEIDAQTRMGREFAEKLRAATPDDPLKRRMRETGNLS